MIHVVEIMGGKPAVRDIHKELEILWKTKFLPEDLVILPTETVRWKNRVSGEQNNMIQNGILKNTPKKGDLGIKIPHKI